MHLMMSNNRPDTDRLTPAFSSAHQFGMNNGSNSAGVSGNQGSSVATHVTLPPISSFDNLIRAAEKQYVNTRVVHKELPLTTSPVMLSYQLSSPQANSIIQRRLSSTSSASSCASSSSFSHKTNNNHNNNNINNHSNISINNNIQLHSIDSSVSPPLKNASTSSSLVNKVAKGHKPRKKKECPICHNFYANLSTHKSTHLTPEDRPHKCPICNRGFARNNDLIRHKKRHWKDDIIAQASKDSLDLKHCEQSHEHEHDQPLDSSMSEYDQLKSLHQIKGTFKCPYNSSLIQLDMEVYPYKSKPLDFETSNCHQTGVFSRCDTFKNHLKALHFEYPPGTKKKDRSIVPGRCKHCGLKFPNVDVWLNEHVGKTCGYSYH